MEDDLSFFNKMEDNLNFFGKIGDNLNLKGNRRRPKFLGKWKTT